jgi:hypothetical protein
LRRTKGGQIEDEWHQRFAQFSELTLDKEGQRVFLVDCDAKYLQAASSANKKLQERSDDELREAFERWWVDGHPVSQSTHWGLFRAEFARRGIVAPVACPDRQLRPLLDAIYTAKKGVPVGWGHKKLISVAHTMDGLYKHYMAHFRAALLAYGRAQQVRAEDKKGFWVAKVKIYKARMQDGDPAYVRSRTFDGLIEFLFPEVWTELLRWDGA